LLERLAGIDTGEVEKRVMGNTASNPDLAVSEVIDDGIGAAARGARAYVAHLLHDLDNEEDIEDEEDEGDRPHGPEHPSPGGRMFACERNISGQMVTGLLHLVVRPARQRLTPRKMLRPAP
jgi:hypothetical protein